MNTPEILQELELMGLTFRPDGNRLAHHFSPPGPVDNKRMGELLVLLNPLHRQAVEYLKGNEAIQDNVIPFSTRRG